MTLSPHLANVAVHVIAGAVALLAGLWPLLTKKGSTLHRRGGRVFAIVGAVVFATALVGVAFYDAPAPLVAAFVAAGYQFVSGLRTLQMHETGPRLFDAAFAVAGLGACAALFVLMGPGTQSWTPAIGYSTIGFVSTVALYDLSRFAWRETWRTRAWRLDHGLKLTAAYFGMASAGVGNVFRDAQPWSQVGPSIVGVGVMLILFALHTRVRTQK